MSDYVGHYILVCVGMGITAAGIMETRRVGPIVMCWLGQIVIALTLAHVLIDLREKIN